MAGTAILSTLRAATAGMPAQFALLAVLVGAMMGGAATADIPAPHGVGTPSTR
jgi:hypothetical protein